MSRQINEEKVNKYFYRLRKAVQDNNREKSNEYFTHLKYHTMVGGDPTVEEAISAKLGEINQIIGAIKTDAEKTKKNYQERLTWLGNQKEALQREIKQLRDQAQAKMSALEVKLNEASQSIQKASEETAAEKAKSEAVLKAKNDEIANLTRAATQTGDEREKEIAQLGAQITKLTAELAEKAENISRLQEDIDRMTGEKTSESEKLKGEISQLKEKVNTLITTIERNMQTATEKVAQLKTTNSQLLAQMQAQNQQITALNKQVQEVTAEKVQALEEKRVAQEQSAAAERTAEGRLGQLDTVLNDLKSALKIVKVGRKDDISFLADKVQKGNNLTPEEKERLRQYKTEIEAQKPSHAEEPGWGDTLLGQIAQALDEA